MIGLGPKLCLIVILQHFERLETRATRPPNKDLTYDWLGCGCAMRSASVSGQAE